MKKHHILFGYFRRTSCIGFPSLRELKLVTLHCAIQQIKYPLNSTEDFMEMYPDCFDKVDKFTGEYYIVLKTNSNPVNYIPRKCPIHLKDAIKAELEAHLSF